MRGFGADQRCAGRAWTRGGGAVALLSLPHWHQLHGLGVAHGGLLGRLPDRRMLVHNMKFLLLLADPSLLPE
jgi:hypothetical protein